MIGSDETPRSRRNWTERDRCKVTCALCGLVVTLGSLRGHVSHCHSTLSVRERSLTVGAARRAVEAGFRVVAA